MKLLTRITHDPHVMGGKPCLRGLRVTVGTVVGLVAAGRSREEILTAYPYLESDDIGEALAFAGNRGGNSQLTVAAPARETRHDVSLLESSQQGFAA